MAAVCEWCELLVQEPHCNLRSEKVWPSYGWRRVEILNGGRATKRAKTEGRNTYGGVFYRFYCKYTNKYTVPIAGQVVLQLHPALNLLHHGPVRSRV